MSNLQLFQQAFEVNFPVEIADQVLGRIQSLYGAEFDKKYGHFEMDDLQRTACTVLNGLGPNELRRGLERMNSEKWCPSLPEFRSWCVQAGDWWTAEQAWAKAMNFEADPSKPITKLAKCALDEVRHILNIEGQRSAHFAFKDIYQDYLQRAKDAGRVQEMWVAPKAIAHSPERTEQRRGVPCPPELLAKLGKGFKRIGNTV